MRLYVCCNSGIEFHAKTGGMHFAEQTILIVEHRASSPLDGQRIDLF